ncbi:hypothetical protein GQ457_03G036990 [Hibiscus cannabinus]
MKESGVAVKSVGAVGSLIVSVRRGCWQRWSREGGSAQLGKLGEGGARAGIQWWPGGWQGHGLLAEASGVGVTGAAGSWQMRSLGAAMGFLMGVMGFVNGS